ncbi:MULTISPECIES: methylated-DNA--[protein]-cysteine S-methyltransferase [Leptolyngbya]|jgi:methylated-DNA-[protein]-cysteine S-methyltransferase|uniref:Methylated-DNA--protein-cysteine methyltransferase n=2 Tax=Leptolyngbya boryana TaxID=1184 RepID=A0A1Z4JDW2_LEPBY|nr:MULTISPECIES: methylated-DNA--[protein]-cysteine S-methyltransferase [Leptolyngbya]BAY54868.1 methylated-DNA-[protein]-cysteine S-methyltransferase Ogt [Leptolyngbya boryana NIES-2135]MBD1854179.1 methylated-DNA--[protein]-cysteine S-methyltransferase [Leptolyngbya sp. FACHB-1624]MBD2365849.1 methylated-DNA--[protein]-cysteine S-methyltransferase [Leptolyngbya sp. FACHB-161]MBD2372029.1 methylated-DNA--[protein]-cysteine S-methyltransferase [Leptolyngbya sp. FACHB-238]MBD2396453.1 methylate
MIYYQWFTSPLGQVLLTSNGQSLTGLHLHGQKYFPNRTEDWQESTLDLFVQVQEQLTEYFAHQRQQFDLPLEPQGTPFQKQVWQLLTEIPFGQTISYGTLAKQTGNPTASRAVGAANGRNPIAIVVPCHRVIAANGALTGYAGGVDRKQWLLRHEQAEVGNLLGSVV